MPTAEAQAQRRQQRHAEVDYKLHRLRLQVLFLFFAGVILAMAVALYAQVNTNRVEYARYDACIARVLEISKYNAELRNYNEATRGGPEAPSFPLPTCGPDPRTD